MHMVAHRSRDTDTARRAFSLKPRRHIHRVAVQVSPVGNRVAKVDPDAEADGPIGRLVAIVVGTCCCTFTAQRTAPSMLSNTMSSESPPVWTILPPCSSIAGSIRSRRRPAAVRAFPHRPTRSGGCSPPCRHRRRRPASAYLAVFHWVGRLYRHNRRSYALIPAAQRGGDPGSKPQQRSVARMGSSSPPQCACDTAK